MAKLNGNDRLELERMLDSVGPARLIDAIAEICHEKSDHVASNWQDMNLAKAWRRDGVKLDKLSAKLES